MAEPLFQEGLVLQGLATGEMAAGSLHARSAADVERHRAEPPPEAVAAMTLAAYTAHEVRNPLAALRAMAQLTLTSGEADVRRAMMQQIVAGIDELDQFLQQILSLIRPESAHMQRVDVGAILRGVVQLFAVQADAARVDVQLRLPSSLPAAWGNPDLLRHVFINLLKNALEAMSDGGRVVISARTGVGVLRITMRDSGPGIPEQFRERLLSDDPDVTSRSVGGGVGLPFVRKIVTDVHGGRVWFRTKTGIGTVFCVELPATSFLETEKAGSAGRAV